MLNKIREHLNSSANKKLFGILFIIAIVAALPVTVIISQQQQETRQHASELVPPPFPISPTPIAVSSNRVFVTSTTYTGNLGGLSGADAKCQERADAARLGGTWKAWLSDGITSAASRMIHSDQPYQELGRDGSRIANNWNDLTHGEIQNAIDITEFGTRLGLGTSVWTNTEVNGEIRFKGNTNFGAGMRIAGC